MEVNQSGQIDQSPSAVGMTIAQSLPERSSKLREIAEKGDSPDRERARYVLASDYIQTNQGKPALELLVGLEKDYPVLAPYILLKQAQAQDMLGEKGLASDLRQRVLRDYPQSPAAVKAMYLIGQPKLQERAIAEFPSHPLTWEIIRNRLRENSNQPKLQLILAKYATNEPGTVGFLDNLVQLQQSLLTPADWEVIGAAYWDNNEFIKASSAVVLTHGAVATSTGGSVSVSAGQMHWSAKSSEITAGGGVRVVRKPFGQSSAASARFSLNLDRVALEGGTVSRVML